MSRLSLPLTGFLVVASTMLLPGCPSPPPPDSGSKPVASPAKVTSTDSPGSQASSPVQTPSPTPAPVDRLVITPDSLTLNTPGDPFTSGATAAANIPSKYQLVGTVYFASGSVSGDILWTSSNPAALTVDASGNVEATAARMAGVYTITATARAKQDLKAMLNVAVVDLGKVHVDVH